MGHKVNIQVPSYYGWDEQMGIGMCIVFVPNECHQDPRDCQLSCWFEVNGCQMEFQHSLDLRNNMLKLNCITFGCSVDPMNIVPITLFSAPFGKKY